MYKIVTAITFLLASLETSAADNALYGAVTLIKPNGDPRNLRGNVVVFIDATGPAMSAPAEAPKVSQRARRFRPHVLPIQKGTSVEFLNDDRVLHNVYSLSKSNPFDLGNYEAGGSRSVTFDRVGLVKVYCNIHPKMVMNVLVLDHQLFTKTDTAGNYRLEGVPDGDYTVRLWHEWADITTARVSLTGGGERQMNFTIKETKSYVQHKNKFGRNFDSKY